jgi:hypothetical protein
VAAVIEDNLFGLEIDPRCTQIGAFNLALAAWRHVGHCKLPAMNLACSGLAPNMREADWLALAGDNERLRNGMARLYRLFDNAAVLGSLINPRASDSELLVAGSNELQPMLEQAIAQETKDVTANEIAVAARGLAKAAEILAGHFTLVATNVPYLGRGNQDELLKDYCKRQHFDAKADLATCFVERCLNFCAPACSSALVTPQNWLFLGSYKRMRMNSLLQSSWNLSIWLGAGAFETVGGEVVNVCLIGLTKAKPTPDHTLFGIDVSKESSVLTKGNAIQTLEISVSAQSLQRANPDGRVTLEARSAAQRLAAVARPTEGLSTGDRDRFVQAFWEHDAITHEWRVLRTGSERDAFFTGMQEIIKWDDGRGDLSRAEGARIQGDFAWDKSGVIISRVQSLRAGIYRGELFKSCVVLTPEHPGVMTPLVVMCASKAFEREVRVLDKKPYVTTATFGHVPFDLAHWQKVAEEKYPDGLPKSFSSDPTQWLFNGHPVGADQPLHVAMARLVGYLWPRQTGSSFPDCPALGPDGLEALADDDGIVCLAPVRGEASAVERLRKLLAAALGDEWSAAKVRELLLATAVDNNARNADPDLETWLRNSFFSEHCKLFHSRPFIWQIWDGLPLGFSALVSYHKLAAPNGQGRKTLELLTFTYLGDWIDRQKDDHGKGVNGADDRLAAALDLQGQLKKILEGEPPYDLFVRWKPLHQQAIGWEPDINDGVRLNIRPFLAAQLRKGGKTGAGILRAKPGTIKWAKDRGKEPLRSKEEFPWFWGWEESDPVMNPSDQTKCANFGAPTDITVDQGQKPRYDPVPAGVIYDGNRWNDLHYSRAAKEAARARQAGGKS